MREFARRRFLIGGALLAGSAALAPAAVRVPAARAAALDGGGSPTR